MKTEPNDSAHRLILPVGKTTWSPVITFKKVQSWGFFTPKGFVNWKEYKQDGGCEA